MLPELPAVIRGWREGLGPFSLAVSPVILAIELFFQAGLSADSIRRAELCPESLVRDHSPDFWRVSIAHQSVDIELAFALGCLGGKYMALERFAALDLAGRGFLKAFRCAFVRF